MAYRVHVATEQRLRSYLERIAGHLKDHRKRASFAIYAFGLLGDSERKSVGPIAAAATGAPEDAERMHHKLLHFVGQADWSDERVRLEAARYVCEVLGEREELTTFVIDDTGFLKQVTAARRPVLERARPGCPLCCHEHDRIEGPGTAVAEAGEGMEGERGVGGRFREAPWVLVIEPAVLGGSAPPRWRGSRTGVGSEV